MTPGSLFIIMAPSGAGKTSLVRALIDCHQGLEASVSHTTRPRRPGERNGSDYWFVTDREFVKMIERGAFVEYATVFNHRYGTSRQDLERRLGNGKDVILDIDWQGARQVRAIYPDCTTIFILPPSRAILESRLRSRGEDDPKVIADRMRSAVDQLSHYHEADFLIVNDQFDVALDAIKAIIKAQCLRRSVQIKRIASLLQELLDSSNSHPA